MFSQHAQPTLPARRGAVRLGLEACLEAPPNALRSARFGLLMNQASLDGSFRYACDALHERFPGQLAALFSPQHGLWGEQQANMIETPHGRCEPLDLPLYSLYSETRQPTAEMLAGLDCLVIDLQDVGCRVYTFLWTVMHCLQACAQADLPVIVLDRPNPLGGLVAEGPLLAPGLESFVGGASIPLRHGLTLGEMALLLNHERRLGAQVEVVRMQGWRRDMLYADTGRAWAPPSPNMPRFETALVYPGQVLLEGTNLSEGRGTTLPFELAGAPFLDPYALANELSRQSPPGVAIRPIRFTPTFDKFAGQSCGGVALHVIDPQALRSVRLTVALLAAARRLAPGEFAWLDPPYEYERTKMPIDILFGDSRLREGLESEAPLTLAEIDELCAFDEAAWQARTAPFRLYD